MRLVVQATLITVAIIHLLPVVGSLGGPMARGTLYVTALQLLVHVGRLRAGDTVFAHALAGGIGSALLDIARELSLRVSGTASAGKHEFVRQRGGVPFDYRAEDFVAAALARERAGFNLVLDGIGGGTLCRSKQLVARGGTLVSFGFQSATGRTQLAAVPTWLRALWLALDPWRRVRLYAIMPFNLAQPARLRDDVAWIMSRLETGRLSPAIAWRLPLRDIARAHDLLETGQAQGKIVLYANPASGSSAQSSS